MTVFVDELHEAIGALGALDVDGLSDGELDALAITLQRERHRLAAVAAKVVARWEARGVWCDDGSRSSAARLSRDAGTSISTARAEVRRARAMADMPVTAAALADGRLSPDDVDLLAGADTPARHDAFERDEPKLVEWCATMRHAQAVKVVTYWKQRVDAAGCEVDAERTVAAAHLHASATLDGTVRIDGLLDAIGGAVVTTELARLERELYVADEAAGTVRTASQRRAAALVVMATRSASTPANARRPKPLFTVLLGDDSFTGLCELATGTVLSPSQLLPHLGVADLETILFADLVTVAATSPSRSFTGKLRRAVEVRDRHCQHPSGCDVPAPECDVDHIVPDLDGGPTAQWNGRLECRPHNRDPLKHDHGAAPFTPREVTVLDEIRARLRWQLRHEHPDEYPGTDALAMASGGR